MGKIDQFNHIRNEKGMSEAIIRFICHILSFFFPNIDFKNWIRFGDLRIICSCDIRQILPETTRMGHPVGIVIAYGAEIGSNVLIQQNVTIGSNPDSYDNPVIGDNVEIYSGAVVVGDVHIGEGAIVGANSVVLDDVEENTTVAGAPAKRIDK